MRDRECEGAVGGHSGSIEYGCEAVSGRASGSEGEGGLPWADSARSRV